MNLLYFLVSLYVNPTVLVLKSLPSGYIASSIFNTFCEWNYVKVLYLDKKNSPDLDVSQEALQVEEESQCHNSSWCFGHPFDLNEEWGSSLAGSPSSGAPRWSCRIGCQRDSSKSPSDSSLLPSLTLHIQGVPSRRYSPFLKPDRWNWGLRRWQCFSHGGPATREGETMFLPSIKVSKVLGGAWYQE